MALRMRNYFGQFHAMLAKRHDCQQQRKLPRALPIMRYNGERRGQRGLACSGATPGIAA